MKLMFMLAKTNVMFTTRTYFRDAQCNTVIDISCMFVCEWVGGSRRVILLFL